MSDYISPRHGRLRMVTVTTPCLERTSADYQRVLEYREVEQGRVSSALAESWCAPSQAQSRYVILAPRSQAPIYLRLVEVAGVPPSYGLLQHWGWAAVELLVSDVDRVHERILAEQARDGEPAFSVYGAPLELELGGEFRPMQSAGPVGEMVFLTETHGDSEAYDLPRAGCSVDHPFIVVLASSNVDRTLDFYEERLGFERGVRFTLPYKTINKSYGLDPETRHEVALLQVGREVVVEVDRYPDGASERPRLDGHLPPGVAMVSVLVRQGTLSSVQVRAAAVGSGLGYESTSGAGVTSGVVVGPDGELVELLEIEEPG